MRHIFVWSRGGTSYTLRQSEACSGLEVLLDVTLFLVVFLPHIISP
jgi:hypothetical protein